LNLENNRNRVTITPFILIQKIILCDTFKLTLTGKRKIMTMALVMVYNNSIKKNNIKTASFVE
jgi:hypothetical protein